MTKCKNSNTKALQNYFKKMQFQDQINKLCKSLQVEMVVNIYIYSFGLTAYYIYKISQYLQNTMG